MSPLAGSQPSGDLQRWLRDVRAGSGEGLRKVLAVCREHLAAIAATELPAGPGREAEVRTLVDGALLRLPELLATFEGSSDADLRAWLRQVLLGRLPAPSEPRRPEPSAPAQGDTVTHGYGSPSTPEVGDARPAGTPAAATPTEAHRPDGGTPPPHGLPETQTTPAAAADPAAGGPPPGLPPLDGFADVSRVGAGGMGIVYRAWQVRLERWVALKCLPPEFAADPDRLRRFRQETLLAAGLTEPGIVQVHDVLEAGGAPVLVLPYIDGCDLGKILGQRRRLREGKAVRDPHPAALEGERAFAARLLPFFDKVLDALVGLHGAGVLHRDLKPSNILVDKNGNGWLTDFGLARLHRPGAAPREGPATGTQGFMSPEQWDGGEDVDARTDVFAMGVTLYEAFALELPYGKDRITAATPPARLSKAQRRWLPPNLDLVLLRAVHPDRQSRYRSAADLRDDWQRVRKGLLPQKTPVGPGRRLLHVARRRTSLAVAAAAAGLAAVLAAALLAPAPSADRKVLVTTEPPGARVALVPLDPLDLMPQFDKALQPADRTPVTLPRVPPGDYLVVAEVPGHGFHEVYRHVPERGEATPPGVEQDSPHRRSPERGGVIEVPLVRVPKLDAPEGMVLFPGGEFTMGSANFGPLVAPPHARTVEPFYLDKTEVTVARYRAVRKGIPRDLRGLSPGDDDPVRFVTFDQAVGCAEEMGRRLPDEAEYEFAATNGGKNRFPWGDDFDKITEWKFGPVGTPAFDRALAHPAVCGLFSNVAEWTTSSLAPYPGVEPPPDARRLFQGQRVVRGGPWTVAQGTPRPRGKEEREYREVRYRYGVDCNKVLPGLGFRCARSLKPRFPQPPGPPKL